MPFASRPIRQPVLRPGAERTRSHSQSWKSDLCLRSRLGNIRGFDSTTRIPLPRQVVQGIQNPYVASISTASTPSEAASLPAPSGSLPALRWGGICYLPL